MIPTEHLRLISKDVNDGIFQHHRPVTVFIITPNCSGALTLTCIRDDELRPFHMKDIPCHYRIFHRGPPAGGFDFTLQLACCFRDLLKASDFFALFTMGKKSILLF